MREATKMYENYYECPHGCGAVYNTYSFNNREFECYDCRKEFKVPNEVKLNKPRKFKKKKREVSNG